MAKQSSYILKVPITKKVFPRLVRNGHLFSYPQNYHVRDFLVIQWLKFCNPNAGGLVSIPSQGPRSHML